MSDDDDKIRMVVRVSRDAHPELYEELQQRSQYQRPERLRSLATAALLGRSAAARAPVESAKRTGKSASVSDADMQVDANANDNGSEIKDRAREKLNARKNDFKKDMKF